MVKPILRVKNLKTRFFTEDGQVNAVENVSFTLNSGEVFGVVGESGSGKSVTALSIIGLVDSPGEVTSGQIWYRAPELAADIQSDHPQAVDNEFVDLTQIPDSIHRSLRGPEISIIFQDPLSSFNPSVTVGEQIAEAVEVQRRSRSNPRSLRSRTQGYGLGKFVSNSILPNQNYVSQESRREAMDLLKRVGIPDPSDRVDEYPHEFSGGMLQRAMIAQALAGEPDVLIADEPTTALDVTIQTQILNLLEEIQSEIGTSIILITHNLGVIARMSDRVGVMYAGEMVEWGTLTDIFDRSVHPYTQGLLESIPNLDGQASRLSPIEGTVPDLLDKNLDNQCYFADRCPKAMKQCLSKPPDHEVTPDHEVKCVLANNEYDPTEALQSEDATAQVDSRATGENTNISDQHD